MVDTSGSAADDAHAGGINPFEILLASQRRAVGMVTDAAGVLLDAGKAGVTHPEELLSQVTTLARAVGDLAASTTGPLEVLLKSQRDLSEAMASFAAAQREMANVLDIVAENHAQVVTAMESVASPLLAAAALVESEERSSKKTAKSANARRRRAE